ncbi:MAG: non-heme iron oxygenase ferredoxin subunit [Candidatus Promineifilaceae bacterium]|jgi:3-phenylpropionate/trans-cinnamate dioxygenase ferredoxin component
MTEFVKVASTGDIAPGERLWLEFEEETVVLFNVNGTYYCIADVCTHDGGPLEDGELDGYEVECPRHGARFDVRTGAALCLPAVTPVPTFEVKVEGEDIYIEDPDAW